MYLSWSASYEGTSDSTYFGTLLPRLMFDIIIRNSIRNVDVPDSAAILLGNGDRTNEAIAREICDNQEAFHVVFIHSDLGGAALAAQRTYRAPRVCELASTECNWPGDRCIPLEPQREMEAWALADPRAVLQAIGYRGPPTDLGLPTTPQAAEALADPKAVLQSAFDAARGPRRRKSSASSLLRPIAMEQCLGRLRQMASFRVMETRLEGALRSLGVM